MKTIYNLKNTNMYLGAEQKTRPKPSGLNEFNCLDKCSVIVIAQTIRGF